MNNKTTQFADDEARWGAVMAGDRAADGAFVLAVRTTGIYCRPSCSARKPLRHNVTFYERPEQARQAGFRPCKRCTPDAPLNPPEQLTRDACRLIREADSPPSLTELGQALGVSPWHLQRVFKKEMGISPRQFAAAQRAARLRENLQEGAAVTDTLYNAGYRSSAALYEEADDRLGMQPARYRAGGAGETIRYCITPCQLGHLLVAQTARGLCAVRLGDDPVRLEAELRGEFPAAWLEALDPQEPVVQGVRELARGQVVEGLLPLDLRATAFQEQVWAELRRIPRGETRTYAAVAQSMGRPAAVRAVANACAANPLALVTPCHRVVRSDGGLGGYRWGMARKKALLESETRPLEP